MICVIATIEIAQGQRERFLEEFHRIVPNVRDEEGCLEYGPTVDVETDIPAQGALRSNVVTVVEKWESVDALKAHLVAPHMLDYRQRVKDIVLAAQLQIVEPA
ncbi:MAG: putative quinol monooxygenase [Planctomycetota bacterium]|nr:putative quinol monooxygenase [Planctomycetota bacterium]